ncbi:DNA polymerase processivity factor [Salinibacter phage M1EM-1]|uniref:DNA polymerase III beta subunit n=1 Tax=Salinibacter phage M1EM-1 TaxID=2681616 RepID=A0A2I6UG80_9CAUD|nr:DNA polymerase processivity factor [Salinibacter phage M1EM-1]AUO78917.1 DNA polymerase III beta subunit [Salinibacter phage M1EM-1]
MKFTADSDTLYETLRTAGRARPSSATMPILETVLLTQDGSSARARCTNLEQHVRDSCEVSDWEAAPGPSSAALPYKRLTDTLKALPETEVQVRVGPEYKLQLEAPQGSYEMMAQEPDNFPELPDLENAEWDQRLQGDLMEAIERAKFAAATDHLRPAMMGLYVGPQGRVAVATDGHRLSKLDVDLSGAGEPLIIPDQALPMIERVDPSMMQGGNGAVAVRGDEGDVFTKTIDETYPSYDAVIPDNDDEMVVDREALLGAVTRAGIYTSSMMSTIRLSIFPDHLVVEGEDVERSSEASETVPCEYSGEETLEIGFNAEYLEEILSVATSERVRFELGSPNDAAVVRPQGREDHMMLLMPVMLNDYA